MAAVGAPKPHIFVVETQATKDAHLVRDLQSRFGHDYEIRTSDGSKAARRDLEDAAKDGVRIAVVAAPLWTADGYGIAFLAQARELYPGAKRFLIIGMGDVGALPDIRVALTLGHIDFYFGVPYATAEEEVYPLFGEALRLWALDHQPTKLVASIFDKAGSNRGRSLFNVLDRNGIPVKLFDIDSSQGREMVAKHNLATEPTPAVILWNGQVLIEPTIHELMESVGHNTHPRLDHYDVAIVGAGPAGLASSVYAASEGLDVVVIEGTAKGGQAGTSSKIRNYLGFNWGISGPDLAFRAWQQAEHLGVEFVETRYAETLVRRGGEIALTLSNGEEILARAVILAGGVNYRRLGIPAVDDLVGGGVFYGATASDAKTMTGLDVFVLGGGNSAGQAAAFLGNSGANVTVLIRGESLAKTMSSYLMVEITTMDNIAIRTGTEIVDAGSEQRLETLTLRDRNSGETSVVRADALFVFIGAKPETAWLEGTVALDDHGFIRTGRDLAAEEWPIDRQPFHLETSVPGVFAAGDIRCRSVKRVASAVGEGSAAILLVHEYLAEGQAL
jgi:thioredoxin reductase (NADPH)